MFSYIYNNLVFNPLYNGLIYLIDVLPGIDAGVAVIIFTIIIRLILFPLSKKAIVTQVRMKEIEPELNRIKRDIPDKQQQALAVMGLYRTKGVNPFSSFLVLFIQLPIIWALYSIFARSGLPIVQETLLYGFVSVPVINMLFFGIVDIGKKSVLMALIAAVAQYFQLHYSLASTAASGKSGDPSIDMAQNMMKNMKYVFPVMVFLISYKISAVIALYWTVGSLFTLAQEIVVRRHLRLHQPL